LKSVKERSKDWEVVNGEKRKRKKAAGEEEDGDEDNDDDVWVDEVVVMQPPPLMQTVGNTADVDVQVQGVSEGPVMADGAGVGDLVDDIL
jgi:hypothetical protein